MARPKISYACSACGFAPPKWVGRCPECGDWGTIAESGPAPSSRSAAS
ncbi:MAG TPA: DNA repair protein RadA, partial [Gordonia sp. (in: high G+C Gram-positive bacteria)]|nr:DNA repair protein RadA [Gordonia sp. (in: high G+C Gram-positive bacteria)]